MCQPAPKREKPQAGAQKVCAGVPWGQIGPCYVDAGGKGAEQSFPAMHQVGREMPVRTSTDPFMMHFRTADLREPENGSFRSCPSTAEQYPVGTAFWSDLDTPPSFAAVTAMTFQEGIWKDNGAGWVEQRQHKTTIKLGLEQLTSAILFHLPNACF